MSEFTVQGRSFDHQNTILDLNNQFVELVQNMPSFLSQIRIGDPITATKAEWLNYQSTPVGSYVTETSGIGSNTIKLANTDGLRVGSILRFTQSNEASIPSSNIQVKVTAVSGLTLTVERPYGGTTDVELAQNYKSFLVSNASHEDEAANPQATGQAVKDYNYTQIFKRDFSISGTEQAIQTYDQSNTYAMKANQATLSVYRAFNSAAIHGLRVERNGSQEGTMGGVLNLCNGGLEETTGGQVSPDIIDNMMTALYSNGVMSNNLLLVMNENQSRRISKFNQVPQNTRVMAARDDRTAGGYLTNFESSLPVTGGFQANVWVDLNMPRDQVMLLNMDMISMRFLRPLQDIPYGQMSDGIKRSVLAEATLEVQQAKTGHAIAKGLDI